MCRICVQLGTPRRNHSVFFFKKGNLCWGVLRLYAASTAALMQTLQTNGPGTRHLAPNNRCQASARTAFCQAPRSTRRHCRRSLDGEWAVRPGRACVATMHMDTCDVGWLGHTSFSVCTMPVLCARQGRLCYATGIVVSCVASIIAVPVNYLDFNEFEHISCCCAGGESSAWTR